MTGREEELAEVARWAEGIEQVHSCIAGRFRRPEPRRRVLDYLRGLVSSVERKNGWQLAEQAGDATPDGCSACCPPIAGMRTWFAMTSGTTWSSIWAPLTGCWWWTRPASSRKGRSRLGCSGSTAGRRGGSRTVRLAFFWPTLAPGAEPCWTGNCICLKYGLRTGSGGRRPEFREMFPFGPSPG